MTKLIKTDMRTAADIIRAGGLVGVPTETVYGLACDGLNENAVKEIYEVKGRPAVKPLALMVPDIDAMEKYCEDIPRAAKLLTEKFWPGPLTIVLKAKSIVPDIVRAGGATVGLRCPAHPLTLEALRLADRPFAAPSANPSGEPSPKNAEAVMSYFDGRIDAVIDGGDCGIGRESTLISMVEKPYRIIRQAALSREEIGEALISALCIVGITGGTGCGKTTALNQLKHCGALVIDCDRVYHELLESSEELLNDINNNFFGVICNGVLDRKALGEIVFQNKEKLNLLNSITHAHIDREVRRRLSEFALSGGELAAIDAIELISSGMSDSCTATVGVIASTETRVRRIMARDGISRDYAEMRVRAQRPNSYFEENCDYTVSNDSTPEALAEAFGKIYEEIYNKWKT